MSKHLNWEALPTLGTCDVLFRELKTLLYMLVHVIIWLSFEIILGENDTCSKVGLHYLLIFSLLVKEKG